MADERAITIPEAARLSGLSRSHLRNLLRTGVIRGEKVGRDWVVTLREVMAYRQRVKRGRPRKG
jgi:excisionase family DNA binding protein